MTTRLPSLLLLALVSLPALAQRLPTGEEHRNHEREVDLLHLRGDLEIRPAQGRVAGRATYRLAPLRDLESFSLAATGLTIDAVRVGGEKASARLDDHRLVVTLPTPARRGEELTVEIDYSAKPRAGMFFQPDPEQPSKIWVSTYGEGGLHRNWIPIYADVNDKLTTEMAITVPSEYVAISNGRLLEQKDHGDGTATFHWRQDQPHSSYLVSIYAGDFERGELEPALGRIPQSIWVPRGRLEEGRWAFRNSRRMVDYFSTLLGVDYPWVKHDQIVVPDYAIGAMEHTSVTGHTDSVLRRAGESPDDYGPTFDEIASVWSADNTISHELAHHWFGDDLTCRELSYLWLNESFASYFMMLWDEENLGPEDLAFQVENARRHYFDYVASEHVIRPLEYHFFDDPATIYNTEHTYLKGAAVLHMMRAVLGDEDFFHALGFYLRKHRFQNVESRDLRVAIEEATGKNLDWFFDDWVTGAGHPVLEASYRYRPDMGVVDLEIRQVQSLVEGQGLFRLPVDVTVALPSGQTHRRVWIEDAEEKILLAAAQEPLWVSVDGEGHLVAEIRVEQDIEALGLQARQDAPIGRMRALGELVERFPGHQATLDAFDAALAPGGFWALRAETVRLIGDAHGEAVEERITAALGDADPRVRKAAVLALRARATPASRQALRGVLAGETHDDVLGTAIVALAHAEPNLDPAEISPFLQRDSWYDEVRAAVLQALAVLERADQVAVIRPFAGASYNQEVRRSAILAWQASAPADPDLHATLLEMAQGPTYVLQKMAIKKLEELGVGAAEPFLTELQASRIDPDLTVLARDALAEIHRLAGKDQPAPVSPDP